MHSWTCYNLYKRRIGEIAHEFTPGLSGIRVTRSLVLCVCFVDCCLSFFLWPLCCLPAPLVSSNSSCIHCCLRAERFKPSSFSRQFHLLLMPMLYCLLLVSLLDLFFFYNNPIFSFVSSGNWNNLPLRNRILSRIIFASGFPVTLIFTGTQSYIRRLKYVIDDPINSYNCSTDLNPFIVKSSLRCDSEGVKPLINFFKVFY